MAIYSKGINQVAEKRKKLFAFRHDLVERTFIDSVAKKYSSQRGDTVAYLSYKNNNNIRLEYDFMIDTKTLSEILDVNPATIHRWARKGQILKNRRYSYSLNSFCDFFSLEVYKKESKIRN